MKPPRAIQYKALFLLVTFSMNTVVGFACSMGVDMGFNSHHHLLTTIENAPSLFFLNKHFSK